MKKNNDLTDQMKMNLKEAKTKKDLDALASSAGLELEDDELDAASGGGCDQCGTFHSFCLTDGTI